MIKKLIKKYSKKVPVFLDCEKNDLLRGKSALITGGSGGIGFSIADSFLKSGCENIILIARNMDKLQKAKNDLEKKYKANVFIASFDLKDCSIFKSGSPFDNFINNINFKIDILVNNAGVISKNRFPFISEEDFDNVIDTNLKSVFFMAQYFSIYMIKNNIKGNILNIASTSSFRPAINPYALSKWGVRGLTLGLAKTLIKYGIVVNGIAPGPTATSMLNSSNNDLNKPNCPAGRYVTAEEISSMAVKLVSNSSRMIIGECLMIGGGSAVVTFDDDSYSINDRLIKK